MPHRPLAAKMRPLSLEDMVGQRHLLGADGLFAGFVAMRKAPSLILWGPAGCGKTTLAEVLCSQMDGVFERLSAVLAGVKDIRAVVERAKAVRAESGQQMYLFIDEIHRFNKAQQDALLPHMEDGTLTLFGATTENPSFTVNRPILSRSRVVVLKPLGPEDLLLLVERGLRRLEVEASAENIKHLVDAASGDARVLLTLLEVASDIAKSDNESTITEEHLGKALGTKTLAYDRNGEEHFNVISAFIKSMRGSDPHAATHYLARMLESGEDPRFILRRMIVFASEDVGNADPRALQVAVSALQAYELMGMPEGYLPLTQAATYLASAPKSNAVIKAFGAAKADLQKPGSLEVPMHLRNAPTALMKNIGYGKNYQYPHNEKQNFVKESYLPSVLKDKVYYLPTENGYEKMITDRLKHWGKI